MAATEVMSILQTVAGTPLPLRVRCWDGTEAGPADAPVTIVFRRRRALRRLLWAPNELGLVRDFVSGDVDVEGDIFALLDLPEVIDRVSNHQHLGFSARDRLAAAATAARLGAIGLPPKVPAEEVRLHHGHRHSKSRDRAAISHHYDVGNDFYRLILGPSMVYSCGYWAQQPSPTYGVDDAQHDKLDLVCTKLGLRPGQRLLDVGCGWGGLAIHAAREYGVTVVGVTLSSEQASWARKQVAEAGLATAVDIRLQDYRDLSSEKFDAISSIGMSEHVGASELRPYAVALADLLVPGGRLLNHAIASVRSLPPGEREEPGFIDRYIFPDGEVVPLSVTLDALEHAGLEVRDCQALREHYGLTLRAWVDNLRSSWAPACALVPQSRARTWLLYLAACALAFEHGGLTVHQVLAVRQGDSGASGVPRTRTEWLTRPTS